MRSSCLVWTDGDRALTNVNFEAFDHNGASLGQIDAGDLSDEFYTGTTAEDRFLGVRYGDGVSTGISSLVITNVGGDGIEIDHVQFVLGSVTGDFNRDGSVDAQDIDLLTNSIRDNQNDTFFDLTRDKNVNKLDLDAMIWQVLDTQYGDTDLDGDVDFADFLKLSAGFGKQAGWAEGSLTTDANVAFDDLVVLSEQFGSLSPAPHVSIDVDTNNDGLVTPADALLVARFLNDPESQVATPFEIDVEPDGVISTRDLNIVVDRLNGIVVTRRESASETTALIDATFAAKGEISESLSDEFWEEYLATE